MILGVLVAVTTSMMLTAKKVNRRLDELDTHLFQLVKVMDDLSESSQAELEQLHETLAEQQRVHQSIRSTSRLIDIVFKRPVVSAAAATHASRNFRSKRKLRKSKKKGRDNV